MENKMIFTAVIEQTHKYRKRMKYIAETNSFIEKGFDSLGFTKKVHQPYGWIKESGTPPMPHLDVYIMTNNEFDLGDEVPVNIIGVFWRIDGDHKLVSTLLDRKINDFSQLDEMEKEDLKRLYAGKYDGEGWYGKGQAEEVIRSFFDTYVIK